MKGQYFLIATVFIVASIILIKGMFGLYDIARERRFHEGAFLDKNLENLEDEYKYLIGVASLHSDPKTRGIDNLWNFTNFTRGQIKSKILYVFVYSNNSEGKYYVTIGNFLDDKITATINVTNSSTLGASYGTMSDKQNTTNTFTPSINGTINITLTYNTKTDEIIEKFEISSAKNSVYGFFDIKLETRNLMVRSKETYNKTIG